MPITLEEMIAEESPQTQARIYKRAQQVRDEINLRELRRFRKLTQTRLSKKLKIGQEGISRMEKRADMYISTLRGYVEGVGGKLSLVVEFPDQPPVVLAGLGLDEEKVKRNPRKKVAVSDKSRLGSTPKSSPKNGAKRLQLKRS